MNNRLMQKPAFIKVDRKDAKDNDNKPDKSDFT